MVLLGKDLSIWIDNGAGKLVRIGKDRSCTISIQAETKSVTGKTLGRWINKRATRLTWSLSSENLFVPETFEFLFEKMVSMEPVTVTFSPVRSNIYGQTYDDTKRYYGMAYITQLYGNADKKDTGKVSISFEGSGELRKVDIKNSKVFDFTFDNKFE